MLQAPSSGSIDVRGNLTADTVNTGYIEKNTQLTLNVIVTSLEHLAAVLAQPDAAVRLSAHGGREIAAATQPRFSQTETHSQRREGSGRKY